MINRALPKQRHCKFSETQTQKCLDVTRCHSRMIIIVQKKKSHPAYHCDVLGGWHCNMLVLLLLKEYAIHLLNSYV